MPKTSKVDSETPPYAYTTLVKIVVLSMVGQMNLHAIRYPLYSKAPLVLSTI